MNYKKILFSFLILLTTKSLSCSVLSTEYVRNQLLKSIEEADLKSLNKILLHVKEIDKYLVDRHKTVFQDAISYFVNDWRDKKFNEERFNIIKLLLTKDPHLTEAIMASVYYGCFELFELLFNHITDINCKDFTTTIAQELIRQFNTTDPNFSLELKERYENLIKITVLFLTHPELDYSNEKVMRLFVFDRDFIDFNTIDTDNLLKILITASKYNKWINIIVSKTAKLDYSNLLRLLTNSAFEYPKIFDQLFETNMDRLKRECNEDFTVLLSIYVSNSPE